MIVSVSNWNSERMVELCPEDFKKLGIKAGDVVKVKGKKTCLGIAAIGRAKMLKEGSIGIGMPMQKRLGSGNGADVVVSRADVPYAERLQFLASTSHVPGERESFVFSNQPKATFFPSDIKLAISALAYMPIRRGENLTVHPLSLAEFGTLSTDEITAPELFRLGMKETVYIKVIDVFPNGEALAGPATEWNEADLNLYNGVQFNITFEQVGGLRTVKNELKSAIEGPVRNAAAYGRLGVRATKGVLLCGPPGCGKTMLAKAVAREVDAELIYVRGPEIYNPYFGASEMMVRQLFQTARTYRRAVIFWDEFDAVGTARGTAGQNSRLFDTILNALLVEMDGMSTNENVIVIAATNRVDQLDPALKRPGRFDRIIMVPLPNEQDRQEILSIHTKGKEGMVGIDVSELAKLTHGFTGADLENLVRGACIEAIEKDGTEKITMEHMLRVLANSKPSLTKEQVEYYEHMLSPEGKKTDGKIGMYG